MSKIIVGSGYIEISDKNEASVFGAEAHKIYFDLLQLQRMLGFELSAQERIDFIEYASKKEDRVYNVVSIATHYNCLQSGYAQSFLVKINELPFFVADYLSKYPYEVIEKMVFADSPQSAIFKFKAWQSKGLDDSFLLK